MTPLGHPPGLLDLLIEETCRQEPTPDRSVKAESRLLPTLNKGGVRGFRGDHNRQGQWQAREPDAPLDVELERWTKREVKRMVGPFHMVSGARDRDALP